MKRIVFVVILFLYTLCLHGQNIVNNGGLFYQILPNQQDVAVIIPQDESTYSGRIVIPATITVDENEYRVTHIGAYAFLGSDISSVTLPEGLLEIGYDSFRECDNLKSVVIPSSVLHIASEAFLFCHNLTTLTFKAKTKPIIGEMAFGRTKVNVKGISTGISSNMVDPAQGGGRFTIDKEKGVVIY